VCAQLTEFEGYWIVRTEHVIIALFSEDMSDWLRKPSIVSLSPSDYMASVLKSASVSLTIGVFLGSALTTGIVVGVAAAWIANEKVLKRLKANALSMLTSARDAALSTREGKALHQTLLALPGAVPGAMPGPVPGGVAVPPSPGCSISRLNPASMYCDATVYNGVVHSVEVPESEEGDIRSQTTSMLTLLEKTLIDAGSGKGRLLQATIYLVDMSDYDGMNQVWKAWLPAGCAPSRCCVRVAGLARPGWRVEIAVTAAQA
jgi:enamine deaminase RidA (YjgF/YER057c/UK114 family)